jgi:hypothetical protein
LIFLVSLVSGVLFLRGPEFKLTYIYKSQYYIMKRGVLYSLLGKHVPSTLLLLSKRCQ